jgi:hypothetical protein
MCARAVVTFSKDNLATYQEIRVALKEVGFLDRHIDDAIEWYRNSLRRKSGRRRHSGPMMAAKMEAFYEPAPFAPPTDAEVRKAYEDAIEEAASNPNR